MEPTTIQQEAEEKICKLIKDFEQTKCDLEQRAEFAEQRAMNWRPNGLSTGMKSHRTRRTLGDGGWGTVKVVE